MIHLCYTITMRQVWWQNIILLVRKSKRLPYFVGIFISLETYYVDKIQLPEERSMFQIVFLMHIWMMEEWFVYSCTDSVSYWHIVFKMYSVAGGRKCCRKQTTNTPDEFLLLCSALWNIRVNCVLLCTQYVNLFRNACVSNWL